MISTPADEQGEKADIAKQMQEATNNLINEITLSVGCEDPNSFRHLSKRTTKITPSRYRQHFQTVSIP